MRSSALFVAVLLVGCSPANPWDRKTIAYDPGNEFGAYDIYRPRGFALPRPAVIFVHGGGWMLGSKSEGEKYADVLCRQGFIVIATGYRLTIAAPWPAQLVDVRAAIRHVQAHADDIGASSLGIMGASAGGQLALLAHLQDDPLAPGQRPTCCVSISGEGDLRLPADQVMSNYDDIMGLLLGHAPPYSCEELTPLSPVVYARADAHVCIVHSIDDSNVFIAQGDALGAAFTSSDCFYARRTGQAHGDDLWLQDGGARSIVSDFLIAHLR